MRALIISFIVVVFLILGNIRTLGQGYDVFLNNSSWYQQTADVGGPWYHWYYTSKDTIVNNINYKKITVNVNPSYFNLVREDTSQKKVYMIPNGDTTEYLLYNFNLSVGNQFIFSAWNANIQSATLVSIDTISTQAGNRKRYKFNTGFMFLYVIEGVGSLVDPFLISNWGADPTYTLICNYQNNQKIYHYNGPDTCPVNPYITKIKEPDTPVTLHQIEVWPNPTAGKFTIEVFDNSKAEKPYQITIYDILGREIKHIESKSQRSDSYRMEVDITTYSRGLYLIQIRSNHGYYYSRVVKRN